MDDTFSKVCLFFICLFLGVIAFFTWRIYDLLSTGDLWRSLLPF